MTNQEEMQGYSVRLLEPRSTIKAVLFDMDGVLVDSIPLHIKAWNRVLSDAGLPELDQKTYLSEMGRTSMDIMVTLMAQRHIDVPPARMQDVVDKKEQLIREIMIDRGRTTPGVMEWLEFLKARRVHCTVASSSEMATITAILGVLQISDYFSSIISGAHLPATKPNPMIFQRAAASVGVEPENCLVIEDAPAGIRAAKAAKMVCCALATTFPAAELGEADVLLENLAAADPKTLFSL